MSNSDNPYGAAERDEQEPPEEAQQYAALAVDECEAADGERPFDEMSTIPATERDTVRMEVAVDVSDMDAPDRKAINDLANLYEGAFREVVNKSSDYGWSFLKTGKKLAQSDGTPFDSAVRSQSFGILTRVGDKHERLIENLYGDGAAEVSDEPCVTAQEAANYYLLLSFILANPELTAELSEA